MISQNENEEQAGTLLVNTFGKIQMVKQKGAVVNRDALKPYMRTPKIKNKQQELPQFQGNQTNNTNTSPIHERRDPYTNALKN